MIPRAPLRALLALAAVLAAAACEPTPATWTVTVDGPLPVGAAVVQVRGEGVREVRGSGDARVFADPRGATGGALHVIVVSASGRASFLVDVADGDAPAPSVTLVSAVDVADRALGALGSYEVRVAR